MKGEIAGLDQAVVGLQTKTDALQNALNLFTTDEALRTKVERVESDVAVVRGSVTSMQNDLQAVKGDVVGLEDDHAQVVKNSRDITTLRSIASTNIVTHRDYLHQTLVLDSDTDLSGSPGREASQAQLNLPINSYQESEALFKKIGRFRGYEGRNTLLLLFHMVSVPRLFAENKLNVETYLKVKFDVVEVTPSKPRIIHAKAQVLLNEYVNSESLTFVPLHFVLQKDCDLVMLFQFNTDPGVPFPPQGALKISKERTALLHFVPLFANLGGKARLQSHPDVADLLSGPPYEDFADLAIRMMHHTQPVPPFYVHHRLFVRNVTVSVASMRRGAGVMISGVADGCHTFFHSGKNTSLTMVGTADQTKQDVFNLRTVGAVGNVQLDSRYHIHGFIMPEYVYFGLQGYPMWLDVNGFNLRPGTTKMCVQIVGFSDARFGVIDDRLPTVIKIHAKPPGNDQRLQTAPDAFPELEFLDEKDQKHSTELMSWFSVQFPSVHDSDHFKGGGALVEADGTVNWETICRQFPASPRYNLGSAPPNPNGLYYAVGVFFLPKDYSGSPYNYVLSDKTVWGFGNDGSEGILGEGVFRSTIRPNGFPPYNLDVWFPINTY